MQNLGTLDNRFTILTNFRNDLDRKYYTAEDNQNNINRIIVVKNNVNNNNNFPANEINVLNILQNVNNPHVLHYIGNGNGQLILNNQPPINVNYLIFEHVYRIDLLSPILEREFTEIQAKLIFKKILNGIQAIHNVNICHRNIAPDNFIFDENFNIKIFGFELCCLNANNLQEFVGNIPYVAPEIFNRQPYDGIISDIFSLGKLLFCLVRGRMAFIAPNINEQPYSFIRNYQYNDFWAFYPGLNLSDNFKNLFVRMIAYKPEERPTINAILNDAWMQEINNLNADQIHNLENQVIQELQIREAEIRNLNMQQQKIHMDDNIGER